MNISCPITTPLTPPDLEAEATKSSRRFNAFGVVSLVVAIGTTLVFGFLFALMVVMLASGAQARSPLLRLVELLLFGSIAPNVVAVGLGVAGLFHAGRGKATAIAGIVLGGGTISAFLLILFIGLLRP